MNISSVVCCIATTDELQPSLQRPDEMPLSLCGPRLCFDGTCYLCRSRHPLVHRDADGIYLVHSPLMTRSLLGNRLPTVADDWPNAIDLPCDVEHHEHGTKTSTRSRGDFGHSAAASRPGKSPPFGQSVPDVIGKNSWGRHRSQSSRALTAPVVDETGRLSRQFDRKLTGRTTFDETPMLTENDTRACGVRQATLEDVAFDRLRDVIDRWQPQHSPSKLRNSRRQHRQQQLTDRTEDADMAVD